MQKSEPAEADKEAFLQKVRDFEKKLIGLLLPVLSANLDVIKSVSGEDMTESLAKLLMTGVRPTTLSTAALVEKALPTIPAPAKEVEEAEESFRASLQDLCAKLSCLNIDHESHLYKNLQRASENLAQISKGSIPEVSEGLVGQKQDYPIRRYLSYYLESIQIVRELIVKYIADHPQEDDADQLVVMYNNLGEKYDAFLSFHAAELVGGFSGRKEAEVLKKLEFKPIEPSEEGAIKEPTA